MQGAAILLESIIVEEWSRSPDSRFVFPSELVAESWARHMARSGAVGTVALERFLSWDSFKESVFPGGDELMPANALLRALFAEQFLAANKQKLPNNRLQRWLFPAYAEDYHPFVEALTRILPGLGMVLELFDAAGGRSGIEASDPQLWADFRSIHSAYATFLEKHGYYEALEQGRRDPKLATRAIIFMPALLEDWARFRPVFEARPEVRLVEVSQLLGEGGVMGRPEPDSRQSLPALHWHQHFIQEIHAALDSIEALVQAGTHPSDIAITLGSWEAFWPYLQREAAGRSIPLIARRGKPLSQFAAAQFFSRLRMLSGPAFSFELYAELVLDSRIPWRPELLASLRQLYYYGIERNWALASIDDWIRLGNDMFRRRAPGSGAPDAIEAANPAEALKLLRRCGADIQRASSFKALGPVVERTLVALLGGSWEKGDEAALQRSRVLLSKLASTEEQLGLRVPDPAGFWLSRLQSSIYVAQQHAVGVEVLPFRVSAGLAVPNHFILGLDYEAAQIFPSALGFLREDQRGQIRSEFDLPVELGPAFLAAYAAFHGGAVFSGSLQNASGAAMPPARTAEYFQLIEQVPKAVALVHSGSLAAKEGAVWYETVAADGLISLPGLWKPSLLLERLQKPAGAGLALSNAQLRLHQSNPLDYLLRYGFGLETQESTPAIFPPLLEGTAIHEVLGQWFGEIRTRSQGRIVQREFSDWGSQLIAQTTTRVLARLLPPLSARLCTPGFRQNLVELAAMLAQHFDGCDVECIEADLSVEVNSADFPPGLPITLAGRIDLIVRDNFGLQLIDFKRGAGSVPSLNRARTVLDSLAQGQAVAGAALADLDQADDEDATDEGSTVGEMLQLPVYRMLAEGRAVGAPQAAPQDPSAIDTPRVSQMKYIVTTGKAFRKDREKSVLLWFNTVPGIVENPRKKPLGADHGAALDSLVGIASAALLGDIARGRFEENTDWRFSPLFRSVSRDRFMLRFEPSAAARGVERNSEAEQ